MGVFNGRRNHRCLLIASMFTAMLFLIFASTTGSLNPTRKLGGGMRKEREDASGTTTAARVLEGLMFSRLRLSGPGSSPPSCRSKCGRCTPCTPVHVPVHPGLSIPLEYYPEAWRCKCGKKLYMP